MTLPFQRAAGCHRSCSVKQRSGNAESWKSLKKQFPNLIDPQELAAQHVNQELWQYKQPEQSVDQDYRKQVSKSRDMTSARTGVA